MSLTEIKKCVKGRKITENIHWAKDLTDAILKDDEEAAYIFIDQEKGLDHLSYSFLFKTLKQFGFGGYFIKWINIIYTDVYSRVEVNGFLSDMIEIQKGVWQECPLSVLLYVLCIEVLYRILEQMITSRDTF